MKRIIISVPALFIAVFLYSATGVNYIYTDAATLPVFGKVCENTTGPFTRFPRSMYSVTREAVTKLSEYSAGLFVRFTSDAGSFRLKWTSGKTSVGDNMSAVCSRGLALYTLDEGEWVWVGTARPRSKSVDCEAGISCSKQKGEMHEYMLYLSLYDKVNSLSIGVPEGSVLKASELDSPRRAKAVVMYGTSILQGASASHPGMCGTAQLSRRLDRVVVNLGFSGNAKLDHSVARLMASYPDPGVFVMDNLPNCSAKLIKDSTAVFAGILREAHPDVPIVFVENPVFPGARFDFNREELVRSRNEALHEVFLSLKKSGMKKIYYVNGDAMLGKDNVGTIEGTHFTDIGFSNYTELLYPLLKKLLK